MRKFVCFSSIALAAMFLWTGCEDQQALKEEKAEKARQVAYDNDFENASQYLTDAKSKEAAGQMPAAQALYQQAHDAAEQHSKEAGNKKQKFFGIVQESTNAIQHIKDKADSDARAAANKAIEDKKIADAQKKAAEAKAAEEKKNAVGAAPSVGVGTTPTAVTTEPVKPVTPTGTPAAGGGDDDDVVAAGKKPAVKAPGGGDPAKPVMNDDKNPFKCYKVVVKGKYAIAYVTVKNSSDKAKKIIRFDASFATDKGEKNWPAPVFFYLDGFVTTDWNDLDKDNPNSIGVERLQLEPGQSAQLILMSDQANTANEYNGAVKLIGAVMWSDGSQTNVVN